jgi:phosphatidylglycerophosphatase A
LGKTILKGSSGRSAAVLLATWFGCGWSPVAPGTAGSLAALLMGAGLVEYAGWPPWTLGVLAAALFLPACWVSGLAALAKGKKDPGYIVIDEVVGQWIAMAGILSWNWKVALASFALFRLFDITKPFPARRLESLPGGLGIVADDAAAGIYAALVLFLAGCFNLY